MFCLRIALCQGDQRLFDLRLPLYRYAVPLPSLHKLAIPVIVIISSALIAAALAFAGTR
jgi:hypothetical protein